jgi:hypothetical protein
MTTSSDRLALREFFSSRWMSSLVAGQQDLPGLFQDEVPVPGGRLRQPHVFYPARHGGHQRRDCRGIAVELGEVEGQHGQVGFGEAGTVAVEQAAKAAFGVPGQRNGGVLTPLGQLGGGPTSVFWLYQSVRQAVE